MEEISKELYDSIMSKPFIKGGAHIFTLNGEKYALMSTYTPTYRGDVDWVKYTEMIVVDEQGCVFHLTLSTDRYDYGCPLEYYYQLRFFFEMNQDEADKYFIG